MGAEFSLRAGRRWRRDSECIIKTRSFEAAFQKLAPFLSACILDWPERVHNFDLLYRKFSLKRKMTLFGTLTVEIFLEIWNAQHSFCIPFRLFYFASSSSGSGFGGELSLTFPVFSEQVIKSKHPQKQLPFVFRHAFQANCLDLAQRRKTGRRDLRCYFGQKYPRLCNFYSNYSRLRDIIYVSRPARPD